MFNPPPIVVAIFLLIYALAGALLGVGAGWITAWIAKSSNRRLVVDVILGAIGAPLGVILTAVIPWPQNTIMKKLEGGGTMTSTMNRYQYPERAAIFLAIVLPILYELYRAKKRSRPDSR